MLAKLPEWKCRQKVRQRICDDADPETAVECFQISVNVIEAKNIAWSSSKADDAYVIVSLGKEKHKTFLKKQPDHGCRQFILFEWYTNLNEIQRSHVCMALMEPRCCAPPRLLGETSIDLGVIWAQPHHQVFHKWAQLTVPRNPTAETVGFLKVDISIMTRKIQAMPVMLSNEEHHNILQPASEQQVANYILCIYNAFGIVSKNPDPRQDKLPSTYVKVTFSGVSVKTAVQVRTNNPCYCERVSITEVFPNTCQSIRLDICSTEHTLNPVLASVDLNLAQISHDGDNGFVPTFGPSLLHMYGDSILGIETPNGEGPFYRGALLIAMRTIVPYLKENIQTTNVEPTLPLSTVLKYSIRLIPLTATRMMLSVDAAYDGVRLPRIIHSRLEDPQITYRGKEKPENLWMWHDYCIFCPIFEVGMLNRQLAGKRCGVAFTITDIPCKPSLNEDFITMKAEIKNSKLHYSGAIPVSYNGDRYGHLDFNNSYIVLQHATRLPGFRFRMYRNNFIRRIVDNLMKSLDDVDNRLNNYAYSKPSAMLEDLIEALNAVADNILKFFEYVDYFNPSSEHTARGTNLYSTELDQKQLALHKEELEKIYQEIKEKLELNSAVNLMNIVTKTSPECYSVSKKHAKVLLVDAVAIAQKLRALVFQSPLGWPNIIVWLLNDGSRFAFHKISMSDILFSEMSELIGKDCGRIQTVYLKPLKCAKHLNVAQSKCTCIAGKIELLFWAGLYSETVNFDHCLPRGLNLKIRDYTLCIKSLVIMVKIRVYIYRAKLLVNENSVPPSSFVRINVLNCVRETQIQEAMSSPVWDQVLTVTCMVRSSYERMTTSPPEILVEVYHHETQGNTGLIGRLTIYPSVVTTLSFDYAPKLEWRELFIGSENVGKILISASLQQLPETIVKSTTYSSFGNGANETNFTQDIDVEAESRIIEEIPKSVKPKYSFYKADIYWWGLRDLCITRKPCAVLEVDNLVVKSDVIADKKPNCNFPHGRISHTFKGNLDDAYTSPLTVRVYDSGTFGRTIYFGTNAVKNPAKYIVDWLPKCDRESSLKTASISSSDFLRVNRTLYIKKSTSASCCSKISVSSSIVDKNLSVWQRLCCGRNSSKEENFLLLAMQINSNNDIENTSSDIEHQDWWSRFFASQKENDGEKSAGKKMKIYDTELERQPEFNKFKDWCTSLKLYNGKKTGIPDIDEELRCGVLKVGIAIYRWPPPSHTVAVNWSGVELDKGYFVNFPNNSPSKFLVRVYVVRGLNLNPKHIHDKCDSYVVINCGAKQCGDRAQYISNSINPIFGRTYEFQCSLPEDYLMTLSVYNRDEAAHDSVIGSTNIDLEDRIYSKHRGQVGLASEYHVTGPSKWRDCEKPSDILTKLCTKNHLNPPTFPDGNTVVVNGVEYRETDRSNKTYISATERKENLCLNLLHKWHTLPLCGYHLVPEHVETRSLVDADKSYAEAGKIMMWIDIFPIDNGIFMPLPVDITPRKVEDYELRLIVWHVQSLGKGCLSSKKGLDLYVKAWIGNVEQAHYTDIHYNSKNGEACFNWRMVFNFQYQHSDNKLVLTERGPFTEYEERMPPVLVVQVADSDAESIESYLATLTLDLSAIPRGSRHIERKDINNVENTKKINLFSTRSIRSWWPLKTVDQETGAAKFEGMIDMELHILPKEKALLLPVGIGRDPPFPLPMPNRPESTKFTSTAIENIQQAGGAEYIVIGILLTLIVISFCFHLPRSLENFAFYY